NKENIILRAQSDVVTRWNSTYNAWVYIQNKENIILRAQSDVVTRLNSTYNIWVYMLELKLYIEILASSLTDEWTVVTGIIKVLKPFNDITNYILGSLYSTMSIIYPTISTLHNALSKEYVDEDLSIYDTDKVDFDTMDNISMFDLEEVLDENEELEQIKSLATTAYLIELIKNIIFKLFERYYK
ncbi:12707_t:CDS:2, partial [Dentiscutata erythropus]